MGKYIIIRNMDVESWHIKMEGYIKENGLMIINMDLEVKSFLIIMSIEEIIILINLMEMELIFGAMDRDMMDSGSMDSNMALVCGEDRKEILIRDSGNLENQMDMECIHGPTEIPIKENSINVLNMEKEYNDLPTEICTKVCT